MVASTWGTTAAAPPPPPTRTTLASSRAHSRRSAALGSTSFLAGRLLHRGAQRGRQGGPSPPDPVQVPPGVVVGPHASQEVGRVGEGESVPLTPGGADGHVLLRIPGEGREDLQLGAVQGLRVS